jgi:alkylation response protein AidB-like acyl-CoA dehydrogenase
VRKGATGTSGTEELTTVAMSAIAETVKAPVAPQGRWEADAQARADRLEALLGDPYDPANPHGLSALFAADGRRTPPAATEELLAETGLAAEFVPAEEGGLLTRADLLARALRPVFRRDVALGFGHGITSLFAGGAVWAAGTSAQRRGLADVLLGGGRAAILHHELAHANAILRDEFTARPAEDGGHRLHGRKEVIVNASRADAQVVYARTDPARGPRSHSVFLLDPAEAGPGAVRHLARVETTGMRGALFSGLEFTGRYVPADALVGGVGDGVTLALRTFQVNRSLICGVVVAAADTSGRRPPAAPARSPAAGTRPSRVSSPTCWPATAWPPSPCAPWACCRTAPTSSRRP